jgi:hypothetical protein
MSQTKRDTRKRVGRLTQRVRKVVDEGADTAEEIHKKVVGLPLDVLERSGVLERPARDLRRFQDRAIGAVYDLVRGINHDVTKLANDVLGPPRPRPRKRAAAARTATGAKPKTTAAA